MHFTCRAFLGQPNPLFWSQYWENEPDDTDLKAQKGHLFGLISFTALQPNDNLNTLGRHLIEEFDSFYLSDQSLNIADSVSKAIEQTTLVLKDSLINFSLNLAVIHQNRIYLYFYHSGTCFLFRQNKISTLLVGTNLKISHINGPLLDNDRFLFISSKFLDQYGLDKTSAILADNSLNNIEETLLSHINTQEDQSDLSAVLIEVHFEESDTPLQTSPPPPPPTPDSKKTFKLSLPFKKFWKHRYPDYVSPSAIPAVSRRKKLNRIISLTLLSLLIGITVYSFRRNVIIENEKHFGNIKTQILEKLQEADTYKKLNLDTATTLAQQAKLLIPTLKAQNLHPEEVKKLEKSISELLNHTGSGVINPPVFYDTSLIAPNIQYRQIYLDQNNLYLFSQQQNRLISFDIVSKNHKTVSEAIDLKNYQNFIFYQNTPYVYNTDNLAKVTSNQIIPELKFKIGDTIITPINLASWMSTLYLLDSATIWKVTSSPAGFNPPQIWLKDGTTLDPAPVSFTINGKIWVLNRSGAISAYLRGAKEKFTPKTPLTLTSPQKIIATADIELLLLVDGENQIYLYDKDGQLISKYNLGSKKIISLVFDSSAKYCLILCSDQIIYKLSL